MQKYDRTTMLRKVFKALSLSLALLAATAIPAAAKSTNALQICEKADTFNVFGETRDRTLYGLCVKDSEGVATRWVVPPRYREFKLAEKDHLYYAWKNNYEESRNISGEGTPDEFAQYGLRSSTVFGLDGTKRFELAGEIQGYSEGLAGLRFASKVKVLGLDLENVARQPGGKWVALPLLYSSAISAGIVDWLNGALLLDIPASVFSGVAGYNQSRKIGYIDTNGKQVIPAQFYFTIYGWFHDGDAIVANDHGMMGVIDRTGAWVLPADYSLVMPTKNPRVCSSC